MKLHLNLDTPSISQDFSKASEISRIQINFSKKYVLKAEVYPRSIANSVRI